MRSPSVFLVLMLTALPVCAGGTPPGYYDHDRIVWYDSHDKSGSPWPWKSIDKRQHFAMGAIAGSFGALVAERLGSRHPWAWGLATGILTGVAKEYIDYKRRVIPLTGGQRGSGTAEISDAVWTAVGGGIGASITLRIRIGGPRSRGQKSRVTFTGGT